MAQQHCLPVLQGKPDSKVRSSTDGDTAVSMFSGPHEWVDQGSSWGAVGDGVHSDSFVAGVRMRMNVEQLVSSCSMAFAQCTCFGSVQFSDCATGDGQRFMLFEPDPIGRVILFV